MNSLFGLFAALGMQLLLVVMYVGIMLTIKHFVVTHLLRKAAEEDR